MQLLSHIDLRVRNRERARDFYDALLAPLGATREDGPTFTTYQIVPEVDSGSSAFPLTAGGTTPEVAGDSDSAEEWFGITEDPQMTASSLRVAFTAPSRAIVDEIAQLLPGIGAGSIEFSEGVYGPNYYAVFFHDPDGNALEVCCIGSDDAQTEMAG